ncbi:RMD1 family protein [Thermochromatium tepidum]|uniref:RMD1 family protein n=1 Tax=Thermochromatium tepidum ATCC 43061 TaxID=316276 RepID=A0A6I6EEX5_THETI|nr:RMD1 family protein [Thermochromatium tepidum]QGU32740.1 RMD1 family protein [Thermochromatium tepidum ATCC 43061]
MSVMIDGGNTILTARARLLGRHLDIKRLGHMEALATNPLVTAIGDTGHAVLFRSGAVVLFGVDEAQEAAFIEEIRPFVRDPLIQPEREDLPILIDPNRAESLERDRLVLADGDLARLQVVADILGKSVLLADQEARVALAFDRIEPLAERLRRQGRGVSDADTLLRHIGEALAIQQDMVGRGEIGDKPEILWEHPELERLFLNLEAEYEIRERQLVLERKLTLINDTAGTLLNLLQNKRSLRVEWYIVILIVVEIVLTLYELFLRAPGHG